MISPKELKKLADTCRKAGIKHFKSADFEFSLTDSLPEPRKRAKASGPFNPPETSVAPLSDITEEQILFWSAADPLAGSQ